MESARPDDVILSHLYCLSTVVMDMHTHIYIRVSSSVLCYIQKVQVSTNVYALHVL